MPEAIVIAVISALFGMAIGFWLGARIMSDAAAYLIFQMRTKQ